MDLSKAIELVHEYRHIDDHLCIEDINDALDLLIEAGKRIRSGRDTPAGLSFILLPGETTGKLPRR